MEFFNKMGGVDLVVGEEHTTAKNEARTNKGKSFIEDLIKIGQIERVD